MKTVLVLFAVVQFAGTYAAQAYFRYYVFDEVRTDKLHYEFEQQITIYDFEGQAPRLAAFTNYRVYGVGHESFSYSTESFSIDLTADENRLFMAEASKLPFNELDVPGKYEGASTFGTIELNDREIDVRARPDTETRKKWKAFLDGFLRKHSAAAKDRNVQSHTIQGDLEAATPITFDMLLKRPADFNGKRVRITGYYGSSFEASGLGETKKDLSKGKRAVWVGEKSTFAKSDKIDDSNNIRKTIEGTYRHGPGGHMGLWFGEINRVTLSERVDSERAEQE